MFRRRRLPEDLEAARAAFLRVVEPVERAKAELAEAAPTSRTAGRPLAEALFGFEVSLSEAAARMEDWRTEELEAEWRACDEGLRESLRLAQRLRLEVEPPEGFEPLIATLGDLMAPLAGFESAEDRFRSLRR